MVTDFAELFHTRGESNSRHAANYVQGLLSRLPGKNMERMAETMEQAQQQDLQQFLSDSPWEERPLWDAIAKRADERLGAHRDSMLVIDESCFAKQGRKSVGVARQHNGRLGKTDNCQVGVFSALVKGSRSALVGARLFLPDEWVQDSERCLQAGVPESEIKARTKIELARELIAQAIEQKLRINLIAFDSFYGRDQGLLHHVAQQGHLFMADTPVDTLVWTKKPKGSTRPKKMGESGAQRVDKLRHPARRSIVTRQGENGPVQVQASAQRVYLWPQQAGHPLECWLITTEQTDGTQKFSLSNASQATPLATLVRWQGQRFFVEQTFKNGKSHAGMADYQVRKYRGWQHHMAMVGLALLFILEEREGAGSGLPLLSPRDITELLHWHFCTQPTQAAVIEQIARRHQRRRQAMASKRRVARRNQRSQT